MNRLRAQSATTGVFILLAMSGTVWGQCIATLAVTGATSVHDVGAWGNFSCAYLSPGPEGTQMVDITRYMTFSPNTGADNAYINIVVPPGMQPYWELDAVYIKAQNNGSQCLYRFNGYSPAAYGLQSAGGLFSPADVVVCADGHGCTMKTIYLNGRAYTYPVCL